jgi:glyoxylase-like metal-dependent hydrolase (beta-lactamase superfamily II)
MELAAAKQFYGLGEWPKGTGKIDLGGRVITVIPTPGTHKDGVTFYDSYNKLLYTGDLLYPGRIMIGNDRDYVTSLTRLKAWSESHTVKWVMGGHIEMMFVPGRAYPRFRNHREFEHVLQLEPTVIAEALTSATGIVGKATVVFREEFILFTGRGRICRIFRCRSGCPSEEKQA